MARIVITVLFVLVAAAPTSAESFTSWMDGKVAIAEREAADLQTTEDAEWWGRMRVMPIFSEFVYPETIGSLEVVYQIKMRRWEDGEDMKKLAASTARLKAVLEAVNAKHHPDSYEEMHSMLHAMAFKIKDMDTPAWKYQVEWLRESERRIRK